MQAIRTTYKAPTNYRGSRIIARCARGKMTIPFPYGMGTEDGHRAAAAALLARFCLEDTKQYGAQSLMGNPWSNPFLTGCLPDGSFCHVIVLPAIS